MPTFIKILLLAAFLNGLSWIILVPIWQYSDEPAHFSQVQDIAESGTVPIDTPNTSAEIIKTEAILGALRDDGGNNKYTYHPEFHPQYSTSTTGPAENEILKIGKNERKNLVKSEATTNPPIYYTLASIFYKAFYNADIFTRVFSVRFFSLLLFITLVYISFKCAEIIFKQNLLVYALTALIAFKPMLIFASTGVLPDPLTNLLFSIVAYLCLLLIKNGVNKKYLLFLIVTVLVGLYTRQQFLLATPIIFVALFLDVFYKKRGLKWVIIPLAVLLVLIVISNSFTSMPIFNSLHIPEFFLFEFNKFLKPEFFGYLISVIHKSYAETWPWYWGVYKWLSFTPPHLIYEIINRIVLVCVLGLLFKIFGTIRKKKFDQQFVVLMFMILGVAIYFGAFILWDYFFIEQKGYSFGFQGRYFFPMIIFSMAILLTGFWQVAQLLKKYAKYALIGLVFLMIVFNDVTLATLAATYYSFASLTDFVTQASQYKPLFFKGSTIVLILALNLVTQLYVVAKFTQMTREVKH